MGFVKTAVNVSESEEMAQLTVGISMPPENISIETSFSLLVNTATGLLVMKCEFGFVCIHFFNMQSLFSLYVHVYPGEVLHACKHAHTHTHIHTHIH